MTQSSPVSPELLALLVCPNCGSALRARENDLECYACHRAYPVKEGIPSLLPDPPKGR